MDASPKKKTYVASVRFAGSPKGYYFTTDNPDFKNGDHVVVALKSGQLERAIFQLYKPDNTPKPPCKIIGLG